MDGFRKREQQEKDRVDADRISQSLFSLTAKEEEIIDAMREEGADFALLRLKCDFLLTEIAEEVKALPETAGTDAKLQQKQLFLQLTERVKSLQESLSMAAQQRAMSDQMEAFSRETGALVRFGRSVKEFSEE